MNKYLVSELKVYLAFFVLLAWILGGTYWIATHACTGNTLPEHSYYDKADNSSSTLSVKSMRE